MRKNLFISGSLLGALAVLLGAYGAHGASKILDAKLLAVFNTGVQYQMYHALALLAVSIAAGSFPTGKNFFKWAGISFIAGTILFSGSLYLLAFSPLKLGLVTPVGGLFLVAGWILGICGAIVHKQHAG